MLLTIVEALMTLNIIVSLTSPRTGFLQVDALPITSKPIESTAENLAWQAWIMMPPHEQNLEKSRKVTPKSIFLLPNRVKVPAPDGQPWIADAESGSGLHAPIECPPGQRQFESRCISTLDIDREQLFIQELELLLQHGGNNNQNTYDYDYDYDEEPIAAVEANYKPPMMFKGDELPPVAVNGNFDDAVRPPNEDAPLKFNIFSENYPTDVEVQQKQLTGMEMANVNSSETWSLAQFFAASLAPNKTSGEVQTELGKDVMAGTKTSSSTTSKSTELNDGFPITGIDAIVLPAVATQPQQHTFSFFKNDSGKELVTIVADHQKVEDTPTKTMVDNKPQEFSTQIADLLKLDSLLPLQSPVVATSTPVSTTTTTTLATTATLKATTVQTPAITTKSTIQTTTSARTSAQPTNTAIEAVATATTTMPKQLEALRDADDRVAIQYEQKEERTRSVTLSNSATTATNEPETTMDLLPTTLLPMTATSTVNSKQLDQTTIIGEDEKEAAEETQKLKKSKVVPFGEDKTQNADEDLLVSQATPLPTLRTTSTQQKVVYADRDEARDVDRNADDDQFYYQPVDDVETTVGASTLSQLVPESSSTTAATTTTTAIKISEIDVAAELRAINELVKKGNRHQGVMKKKTAAAAKATKSQLAITTTKATSSQELAANTENSVDFERTAATSASTEILATTVDASSSLIVATTSATTTTAAAMEATTAETTAALWAKIMPLLGYGVTTATTTEIPATLITTTTTSSNNTINSSNSSLSNSNRSHRNSKITRIDKLSTNSLSDNAKKTATTTAITTTKRLTNGSRSKTYVVPLFQATSTELPFSSTTPAATTTDDGNFSPFWWLPAGWRLDRPTDVSLTSATNNNNRPDVSVTGEPSLLLRFWSIFPGNQVKIRE